MVLKLQLNPQINYINFFIHQQAGQDSRMNKTTIAVESKMQLPHKNHASVRHNGLAGAVIVTGPALPWSLE
jgi:hypothetical protein